MGARVFIHPAVHRDPIKSQVLATTLQEWGYDMSVMAVYDPPSVRKSPVHELVRDLGHVEFTGAYDDPTPETGHWLERMDGQRFLHQDSLPEPQRRA